MEIILQLGELFPEYAETLFYLTCNLAKKRKFNPQNYVMQDGLKRNFGNLFPFMMMDLDSIYLFRSVPDLGCCGLRAKSLIGPVLYP